MHWIYILKCFDPETANLSHYYVGETTRLYRRFREHENNKCYNTENYDTIPVAIYKKDSIGAFFEYNEKIHNINNDETNEWSYSSGFNNPKYILENWEELDMEYDKHDIENKIVEYLFHKLIYNINAYKNNKKLFDSNYMYDLEELKYQDSQYLVRGGKYIRDDCNYSYEKNNCFNNLPLCKCGLPCDVKKNINKELFYFRCAKKNMWEGLTQEFNIDEEENEPCNFYKEYYEDKIIRLEYENNSKTLSNLFKKSKWLNNLSIKKYIENKECISCNLKIYNGVKYKDLERNLCFECFKTKNKEISKNYTINIEMLL